MSTTTAAGDPPQASLDEAAKKLRIKAASWTAGVTGLLVLLAMDNPPNWPEAFVLGCMILMVGFVCHQILHYR